MIISDHAVKKRTTVFFLTAVIVIAGIISYRRLPLESFPDVNFPHVFVQTNYRGVSPEDMEKSVTIEIEKKLKGLEGVKKIKSISAEGVSSIDVEFTTDTDIDDALIKVKDKVDLAKPELPTDLEDDPAVFEVNFSEMPILVLSLAGPCGMRQLTKIAEDLQEACEAIDGVLEVELVGSVTREIQIEVDPERMALYAIPFGALQAVVSGENANVSGGSIRTREGRYQLRVPAEFKSAADVEAIVVGLRGGEPVYLRDVARVVDGIEDRTSYSRTNGQDAVSLYVKKRTGENIIRIVEKVDAVIERTRPTWPAGVTLTRVDDRAKDIRMMVEDLENNILTGLILVVVVVMVAMGLRNAILVSLSIPLSMLLSFSVLSALGITLNMVVLFSLTLALGMLVDNAIVIIENIYRFMQQGVPRLEAAMRATSEVAWPIIGSSLTTIGAFFPLLFWVGLMGDFMVFLPKTVIITLGSCLFVSVVINPALAAALMRVKYDGPPVSAAEIMSGGEHPMLTGGGPILALYRRVLERALRCRLGVVLFAGFVLVAMVLVWLLRVGLRTPTEFFPQTDPNNSWVAIRPPEGADLDYVDQIVREAACRLFDKRAGSEAERSGKTPFLRYAECLHSHEATRASTGEHYQAYSHLPNIEFIYEKATVGSATAGFSLGGADNQVGVQFVDLADRRAPSDPKKSLPSREVIKQIEALVLDIPGAEITVSKEHHGPPTGAPINIEIAGDDFNELGRLADGVKKLVARVPYVRNVRSDFEFGSPTLSIRVNRRLAGMLGLTANSIGFAIKSAINGIQVSTFREQDEDYDIVVRFLDADRRDVASLQRIFIPSAAHGLIPLTTVARMEYTGGVGQITRIDHRRVVTVQAEVDETQTTGATARRVAEGLMEGILHFDPNMIQDWPGFCQALVASSETSARATGAAAVRRQVWAQLDEKARGAAAMLAGMRSRKQTGLQIFCERLWWLVPCVLVLAGALLLVARLWRRQPTQRAHRGALIAGVVLCGLAASALLARRAVFLGGPEAAKATLATALNRILDGRTFCSDRDRLSGLAAGPELTSLLKQDRTALADKEVQRRNRLLLDAAFPKLLPPSPAFVAMPTGYHYKFTGEMEFQKESEEFLSWALMVALMIILFVLVAQFNSTGQPVVIMSAVVLSFGGVFLGLAFFGMPFGTIMGGVGVISLAGVVVNNGIVLVDYTDQLVARGMKTHDAIVAAGATRLRPVLLTAISTILALIPMVTGVSFDFHRMQVQWVSESSQFWSSMAAAVIFGLGLATLLTLIVVPVLYSLVDSLGRVLLAGPRWSWHAVRFHWLCLFDARHGTRFADAWRLTWDDAVRQALDDRRGH